MTPFPLTFFIPTIYYMKTFLPLNISVLSLSEIADNNDLISKIRDLTLNPYSGMNWELDNLLPQTKYRDVNCKAILCYFESQMIGWALLSQEPSDFGFYNSDGFDPKRDGALFEVYVRPDYRRFGVGTKLLEKAREIADGINLCICPHDYKSTAFYNNRQIESDKQL